MTAGIEPGMVGLVHSVNHQRVAFPLAPARALELPETCRDFNGTPIRRDDAAAVHELPHDHEVVIGMHDLRIELHPHVVRHTRQGSSAIPVQGTCDSQ